MCADDTNIHAVSDDINKVENVLNNELAMVDKWCTENKLIMNDKKKQFYGDRYLPET